MNTCKICNTEISEHEAGKCLDLHISQIRTSEDMSKYIPILEAYKRASTSCKIELSPKDTHLLHPFCEIPEYSKDLNLADKLLRNFVSSFSPHEGIDYTVQTAFDRLDSNEWYLVTLKRRDCNDIYATGGLSWHKGNTLALAFCRAFSTLAYIEKMKGVDDD